MAKAPPKAGPRAVETNRRRRRGPAQRALQPQRDPMVLDEETLDEVERLNPYDDGPPTGAQHGENHTRRPIKTEVDRGQGPKTRAANRERVKGSRLFNPR